MAAVRSSIAPPCQAAVNSLVLAATSAVSSRHRIPNTASASDGRSWRICQVSQTPTVRRQSQPDCDSDRRRQTHRSRTAARTTRPRLRKGGGRHAPGDVAGPAVSCAHLPRGPIPQSSSPLSHLALSWATLQSLGHPGCWVLDGLRNSSRDSAKGSHRPYVGAWMG